MKPPLVTASEAAAHARSSPFTALSVYPALSPLSPGHLSLSTARSIRLSLPCCQLLEATGLCLLGLTVEPKCVSEDT